MTPRLRIAAGAGRAAPCRVVDIVGSVSTIDAAAMVLPGTRNVAWWAWPVRHARPAGVGRRRPCDERQTGALAKGGGRWERHARG